MIVRYLFVEIYFISSVVAVQLCDGLRLRQWRYNTSTSTLIELLMLLLLLKCWALVVNRCFFVLSCHAMPCQFCLLTSLHVCADERICYNIHKTGTVITWVTATSQIRVFRVCNYRHSSHVFFLLYSYLRANSIGLICRSFVIILGGGGRFAIPTLWMCAVRWHSLAAQQNRTNGSDTMRELRVCLECEKKKQTFNLNAGASIELYCVMADQLKYDLDLSK